MSRHTDDITCKELVELVSAYLEGTLDQPDRRRFEAHLEVCDACRTYVEQIRQTVAAAGRLGEDSLDPPVRDALLGTFRDWKRRREL
ncbi:MAG: anti-sigma factor family protein [Solirubrobacterales bacterium]